MLQFPRLRTADDNDRPRPGMMLRRKRLSEIPAQKGVHWPDLAIPRLLDWSKDVFAFNKRAPNFGLSLPRKDDHLPDFSYVGYKALEEPIPNARFWLPNVYLDPTGNNRDRTQDIQAAVDRLGRQKGGVILLRKGEYHLEKGSIRLRHSNVVIRGEGDGNGETVLLPRGEPRAVFDFGTLKPHQADITQSARITKYVPIGAVSVSVDSASKFKVGMEIVLRRKVTEQWVRQLGMDKLVRDGKRQTWLARGRDVDQFRRITAIRGNVLSFAVPLTDSLDGEGDPDSRPVVLTIKNDTPAYISGSGVEYLRARFSRSRSGDPVDINKPNFVLLNVEGAEDCWIRGVRTEGFLSSVSFGHGTRRITVVDCTFVRTAPTHKPATGGRPLPCDVSIRGTQLLLMRCKTEGKDGTDCYNVMTQTLVHGPNVVYKYRTPDHKKQMLEPHQRWATGVLFDSCEVGAVIMRNRTILGSGQGWAINVGVAWNCKAQSLMCQSPRGGRNFNVGCTGSYPDAESETGTIIKKLPGPESLLKAQLEARKGVLHAAWVLGGAPGS